MLFRKSIDGFEKLGNKVRITKRLVLLGDVLLAKNKLTDSEEIYKETLSLNQKYERQDLIARAKFGLAKVNELKKNWIEALRLANETLASFQRLGMKKYIDESQEMIDRLEK